jgi:hypothetical protein
MFRARTGVGTASDDGHSGGLALLGVPSPGPGRGGTASPVAASCIAQRAAGASTAREPPAALG